MTVDVKCAGNDGPLKTAKLCAAHAPVARLLCQARHAVALKDTMADVLDEAGTSGRCGGTERRMSQKKRKGRA